MGETEGSCRNTSYSSQCGPVAAEDDDDVGLNVLGGRADVLGTKNAAEGDDDVGFNVLGKKN